MFSEHTRKVGDQRTTHELNFDLTALLQLDIEAEKPPPKSGGSRATRQKCRVARVARNGWLRDPSKMEGLTTTSETRLNNHNQEKPGGGDEDGKQVRSALAPSGAMNWAGLGTRLADLLTLAEQRRVDAACLGAQCEQLGAAEAAVRASVAKRSVKSVAALAVALGKAAVRNEVGDMSVSTPAPTADPWPAREARAGMSVVHSRGLLVAEPGARAWRHSGGERDGQLVAGKDALRVWERVEAGELVIQPAPAC